MERIFISSVQKELAAERRALKDYIQGDALLRRFFEVFLFEDLPASDRRTDEVYLDEVDRCDIYLGLFGNEYGFEDAEGVSPTEREFDQATTKGKIRLIFVKGTDDKARHPKMLALIRKAAAQLVRRRFLGAVDLTAALSASLVDHLLASGVIQTRPFEEQPCTGAALEDLDPKTVTAFVRRAREERQFPLAETAALADVMTHLDLLLNGQPTKAAVLLFARNPQHYLPSAEMRCMHFHGTEIARPVPFYRVFKGNLFEQVDQAVDFVLSKLTRSVGTRAKGPQAPVHYELPKDVVAEAIVNAVAHRDYACGAAVQVSVFADRIEVWNPGELPPPLTPERLREPHSSIARNHRICEALFLARYIEKFGTGTLMMIREMAAHGLPEPEFQQRPGELVTVVWRDWLTEARLRTLQLNQRQREVIAYLRAHGRASNSELKQLTAVTDRTILRDLNDLLAKQVLEKVGITGRATHYVIATQTRHKPDKPDKPQPQQQTRHKPDKPVTGKGVANQSQVRPVANGSQTARRDPDINRTNRTSSKMKRAANAPAVERGRKRDKRDRSKQKTRRKTGTAKGPKKKPMVSL